MKLCDRIKCLLLYPFGLLFIIPLGLLLLYNKLFPIKDIKPVTDPFEASEPSNMFNDFTI